MPAGGPARRHLLRLLTRAPDDAIGDRALAELAGAEAEAVAAGLVAEAFASDDVTDGASAQAFVEERLSEWAALVSAEARGAMAARAGALIAERAP